MYMYKKSWMRIRHLFVDWPCIWCEATEVQRPSWNQDLAHQVLDSCEVTDPTNGPRLGGFPSLGPPPPRKLTKTWVPSLGDLWSQKPQVRKSVIVGILSSLSLFFFRFSLFALRVDAPPVAGCSFLKLSFSFLRVSRSQNGSTFVWEGRGKNKTSGAVSDCLSAARLFLRPEETPKARKHLFAFVFALRDHVKNLVFAACLVSCDRFLCVWPAHCQAQDSFCSCSSWKCKNVTKQLGNPKLKSAFIITSEAMASRAKGKLQ